MCTSLGIGLLCFGTTGLGILRSKLRGTYKITVCNYSIFEILKFIKIFLGIRNRGFLFNYMLSL